MAHVSEDYGAAPPAAVPARAHEGPAAAPRPSGRPGRAQTPTAPNAYAAAVRKKLGALCTPRLKPLPA